MTFDSAVTKVQFVGGKYLLALAEDTYAQMMDLETQKVTHFLAGSHEGSIRNAAVDPLFGYLATSGCDGKLHISTIADK